MELDEFINEKIEENNNILKTEDGNVLFLYHGTNRKFEQHSSDKNRTILNDGYQGDWICYTKDEDVAWKYAAAARNQNFEKDIFLKETMEYLSQTEMKDFYPHIYKTITNLMEIGFDKGWEKSLKDYSDYKDLNIDESSQDFFKNLNQYEKEKGFDLNSFSDVLNSVEYSKFGIDEEDESYSFFDNDSSCIPYHAITELKSLGFKECLPEPKVIKSVITAEKILRTKSRQKAKEARDKGFDLVIYSGEGTVDGKPEYLVADPKQVLIQSMEIESEHIESIGIGETVSRIERKKVDLRNKKPRI